MSGIIWAMGGRRAKDIAHAFLSEDDYKEGRSLCGRTIHPHLRFEEWDLTNEEILRHTCPHCRERVKFVEFLSSKGSKKQRIAE